MDYETIRVERVGDVLKIVLNRPERLNACPPNMALEIANAASDLQGARAVQIGRASCRERV